MDSGWMLIGGLTSVGGLAGFAWHEMQRDRGASLPSQPATEEDPPVAAFRADLIRALKNPPPGGVAVSAIADAVGIMPGPAAQVCRDLYRVFARKTADDGVITPAERVKLDALARTLEIPLMIARAIEDEANLEVYQEDLEIANEDGVITTDEADQLERLRRSLGIPAAMAAALDAPGDDDNSVKRVPSRRGRYSAVGAGVGLLMAVVLLLANRPAPSAIAAQEPAPALAANGAAPAGWRAEAPPVPLAPPPAGAGPDDTQVGEVVRMSAGPAAAMASDSSGSPQHRPAVVIPGAATTVRPEPGYSAPAFSMPGFATPSRSPSSHSGGSVHVRAYTRKDGTHVQAHTRSAPRSSARSSPRSSSSGRSGGRRR